MGGAFGVSTEWHWNLELVSHNSLILIGDGQKALFLRNRGNAQRVDLVVERIFDTREQATDRPGRSIAS